MGFKKIDIKKCYETTPNKTELLETFYIPLLSKSTRYFRIAGYFSSTSFMVASKGIEELVNNNGTMRLLISPELSEQDYKILRLNQNDKLNESLDIFKNFDLTQFDNSDNLKLLAWLLANKRLEIKIVVNKDSGTSMFHQKVGIFFDEYGNGISFSGSINETAKGWLGNIEEFKTFKSWEIEQEEYFLHDLRKFNQYWNNERIEIADVYDLPESIENKIITKKPNDVYDLEVMKKYTKKTSTNNILLSLFEHQSRAIKAWMDNDYSILMEMATGTGKTRAAIGCFCELLKKERKILIIISTPQGTLSRQWKTDIEELNINVDEDIIVDGSNSKWRINLENILLDMNIGNLDHVIIYTTHATSSTSDFTDLIKNYKKNNIKILYICDEVHAIGSEKQRDALLECYDYRIGLSATPDRMFDEEGTSIIKEYFGNKTFEFTIHDALNTINPLTGKPFLNKFYYYPRFVYLNEEENEKYRKYSRGIALASENEDEDQRKKILILRSNIIKGAKNKLEELSNIVDDLKVELERIEDTIVFVSDKQITSAMKILKNKNVTISKITETEPTRERQQIIENFKKRYMQVILGIKCLDEGIDIPNARIAIIMASSINPREYVQRVGRVIRQAPNKKPSIIYDMIVIPENFESESDKSLFNKEARRALFIAQNAINYEEVKKIFEMKGANIECLLAKK